MEHRRILAEAGAEPGDHLRGQRDFRHQHNRRPAHLRGAADGADEHLGFAAARHAVKQKLALSRFHRGQKLGQHVLLLAGKLRVLRGKALHLAVWPAQALPLFQLHKAHPAKGVQRVAAVADGFAERRRRQLHVRRVGQRPQHLRPLGRANLRRDHLPQHIRRDGQHGNLPLFFMDALAAHLRGEHQPQRHRQRAKRRPLDFLRQFKQRRQHRGIILQRVADILHALGRQVAIRRHFDDHALQPPRPKRHVDAHAGADVQPRRHAVGEHMIHIRVVDIHDHLTKRHDVPPFSVVDMITRSV